jgi:SH3 domain-containing YSC84-like protein 1
MTWKNQCFCNLCVAVVVLVVGVSVSAADEIQQRFQRSAATLDKFSQTLTQEKRSQEVAGADCVGVIPGFKKGAAVVGAGYGKGFISCRNGQDWSAPAAITLEGGSLGVQIGGEVVDVVIVSKDKEKRGKLLSDRFTIGADASAAWGNGKTAHEDTDAKIIFFGYTKGVFAGFDLDGASVKPDETTNKTLYGKALTNSDIVEKSTAPQPAQSFVAKLKSLGRSETAMTHGPTPEQ